MALCGEIREEIEVKNCGGNLFFDLLRHGPNHISKLSPEVDTCDLHEGQWGTVGSIICWTFIIGGEKKVAKEIVEVIDEEKKRIVFKVFEGDLMKAYKTFNIILKCKSNGSIITWTIEYEKVNKSIPNPSIIMDYLVKVTTDIESNHQAIPRLASN